MTVEGIIAFFGIFVAALGVAAVLMFGLRVVKLIQNYRTSPVILFLIVLRELSEYRDEICNVKSLKNWV